MCIRDRHIPHVGVKEVVLPFNMFPEVDPVLGPEMRSTGEVLGMAPSFGLAYFKAEEAAQPALPLKGTVFISVADKDKPFILETARKFQELGFRVKATAGTQQYLQQHGVRAELSYKVHAVSYTHLRAHETRHDLVCRLLLEKKKKKKKKNDCKHTQ